MKHNDCQFVLYKHGRCIRLPPRRGDAAAIVTVIQLGRGIEDDAMRARTMVTV